MADYKGGCFTRDDLAWLIAMQTPELAKERENSIAFRRATMHVQTCNKCARLYTSEKLRREQTQH